MKYFNRAILLAGLALSCLSASTCWGQNGLEARLDFQYTYMQYGKLHGAQVPFSLSYRVKNTYFGLSAGIGYAVSNWNYDADPFKMHNLDIALGGTPSWHFWGTLSTYNFTPNVVLKGTSGYGVRLFSNLHLGHQFELGGRPLSVEAGAYLTRVSTSFIAAKAEDVAVYNAFLGDPSVVFPTELLFPVSVIYWDIGPFVGLRYQLTKGWRVPMGLSAAYYHGFYDNSTLSLGLYFHLPMGGAR